MNSEKVERIKRWLLFKYALAIGLGIGTFFVVRSFCVNSLDLTWSSTFWGLIAGSLVISVGCCSTTNTMKEAEAWLEDQKKNGADTKGEE